MIQYTYEDGSYDVVKNNSRNNSETQKTISAGEKALEISEIFKKMEERGLLKEEDIKILEEKGIDVKDIQIDKNIEQAPKEQNHEEER